MAAPAARAEVTKPFTGVTLVTHSGTAMAVADLCAPGVSVRTTKFDERRSTAATWADKAAVKAEVAVNADFFDLQGGSYVVNGRARGAGADWPADQQWVQSRFESPEVRQYWQFGPGLAQLVEADTTPPAAGATDIAGAHNVIIRDGRSLAPSFDGDGVLAGAHRRTAVGISKDARALYLFTSSNPMTGTQLAAAFLAHAREAGYAEVGRATNEDGGGSSQMYVRGRGAVIPSTRPVSNHFGIQATGTGPSPMCPNRAPEGALDQADCTHVTGWTHDRDQPVASLNVHLYADGTPGQAGARAVARRADAARPDVAKLVGSPSRGFDIPTPLALMDGRPHEVRVYAIDDKGENPALPGGPKTVTCSPAAPVGALRRPLAEGARKAFRFSDFEDVLPLDAATVDAIPSGEPTPAAPELVRAEGKREVYLIDGGRRRHVTSASSATSWHLDLAKVRTLPVAEVEAMPRGTRLPARPVLANDGSGTLQWLDTDVAVAGTQEESEDEVVDPLPDASDPQAGCHAARSSSVDAGPAAGLLLALGLLLHRRR